MPIGPTKSYSGLYNPPIHQSEWLNKARIVSESLDIKLNHLGHCKTHEDLTHIAFNVKQKQMTKYLNKLFVFQDHKSGVTSVAFNWNDTDIASGSESGEIILYNVVTGQGSGPLIAPKVQVCSAVLGQCASH